MITFNEFLIEKEEVTNQTTSSKKQINNVKYQINNNRPKNLFKVSINPSITNVLSSILTFDKYTFNKSESSSNTFIVEGKDGDTGNKLQSLIFAGLTTAFDNKDESVIKFVGSSEMSDFMDADFGLTIDAIR